ncbi:MAG: 4-hydroxy-tetrahydrodipicolinate reductase [Chloroherpetonaceae bacterium]|nr:4-hydroxy-tetrahydrodipicolinate reductase [Chloroherpetonaceae bacterium]MDW8436967.1 4-hydroxy-tetrahydrodipicolinate reductase [Chloroherpetonaceae bacterium]
MLSIALVGYGKMGKAIDAIAEEQGCRVARRIDSSSQIAPEAFETVDVVIDFTRRDAFLYNLPSLLEARKPIVVGTTGWLSELESVKKKVYEKNGAMIYAANFSLGVQLFLRAARELARLYAPFPEFDIAISETHHVEKLDAPSGTALKLADEVLANFPRKTAIQTDVRQKPLPSELQISAMRLGKVFGEHSIRIDSEFDEITLAHKAKNRYGFAKGALEAAKWIQGRTGVYSIDDFLDEKLGLKK